MFRSPGGRRSKPQNRADAVGFHASRSSQGPTTKAGNGSAAASSRSSPGRNLFERVDFPAPRPGLYQARRGGFVRGLVESLEGARKRVEYRVGGRDLAQLQPLDVVDAHRGQCGHLFASQTFDTLPGPPALELDLLGLDLRPP